MSKTIVDRSRFSLTIPQLKAMQAREITFYRYYLEKYKKDLDKKWLSVLTQHLRNLESLIIDHATDEQIAERMNLHHCWYIVRTP